MKKTKKWKQKKMKKGKNEHTKKRQNEKKENKPKRQKGENNEVYSGLYGIAEYDSTHIIWSTCTGKHKYGTINGMPE